MNIKDADILKFLDGSASQEEVNNVNEWIASDAANSKEMLRLNKMWKELDNYNSIKIPDVDNAWKNVSAQLSPIASSSVDASDKAPGSSSTEVKSVIKPNASPEPQVQILSAVQDKTSVIQQKVDLEDVKVKPISTTPPATRIEYNKNTTTGSTDNVVYGIFGLILLGIMAYLGYVAYKKHTAYIETTTQSEERVIALQDGSSVRLLPFSTLSYPKTFDSNSRLFMLQGDGVFDVAPHETPFVVQHNGVSIRALGTEFTLTGEGEAIFANCSEGKIRFYETKQVDNGVIINTGSTFKYEGGVFEDVTPVPEVEEEPLVFVREESGVKLLDLLDIIMEKSDWKVTSVPSMPFSPQYEVNVDIDANHMEIMDDLQGLIDFEYKKASCANCYVITRMRAPN